MFKHFFIICSGADTDILKTSSNGEQNKYAGIGATVFFTAVMAFIASSYALYTVFDNAYISIGFGLVWGLLIFNLDRFIVSTIKKRGSFFNQLLQATPRLILALIIAIVISKPLELKIFQKEINQVLLTEKNAMTLQNQDDIALQFSPKETELKQKIKTLQTNIDTKEAEVNTLYNTYITEAEGTSGTNKLGKGPVYKEKRDKHDTALADLQLLKTETKDKITAIELELLELKTNYNLQVANTQPIIDGFDGLMARINALNTLPWLPSFFIFLLFLAIETSPIIAKLLSPKGEYDFKLEDQETAIKTVVEQRVQERKLSVKADFKINDKIYSDLSEEDELYQYKRKKARALMQLQADAFYKQQEKAL
ncbi:MULTISPECIES: DUF4407 domain-containing protein [Olleya]|uniref:DUF4407 domain-containing protein n=1 Tax=Olleya namhaensis TaxID=1144750 RepID=A0A1I3IRQ2_9FLAO|nr:MULTISPECIES: DUF4407 domain-containing protein [Olleya]PKG53312.1 DUF4407 domain-containing protein [Olleya sp. 1-3]SFI50547.1 protein of unknown function [Olleya namhaensis]